MGSSTGDIQGYIKAINEIGSKKASEASYRTALENLLNSFDIAGRDITVIQEAKDEHVDGIPDFNIYESEPDLFKKLIGFIECKKATASIDNLVNSEQIQKYAETADNIIVTNYKKFILLQKRGGIIKAEREINLLDDSLAPIKNAKQLAEDFIDFYREFIKYKYLYIHTKTLLVEELAKRSFEFSAKLREELSSGNKAFSQSFEDLLNIYSKTLQYSYETEEFCDIYAQAFVYALLISRLEDPELRYREAGFYTTQIPKNYKILEEFLGKINQAYFSKSLRFASWQVAKCINLIDIPKIQNEFEQAKDGRDSVIVYLYEDFLKEFDELRKSENRKENGVYYTPSAVVNFITRNVNSLIKNEFGKAKGFNHEDVKILDFATGTGSFLVSTIHEMAKSIKDDLDRKKLKDKILADVYGFELQLAPYIVANIVLSKILKDYNIELGEEERLGLYVANTLDLEHASSIGNLAYLNEDSEKVSTIKRQENILAIIGNPPYYNGINRNTSPGMAKLMEDYKKGLDETKTQLNDSYIKFIRFAEDKIARNQEGVIGIITNNSFLGGTTQWQMRKHLHKTFDEIYILNLHGESGKPKEDENVFDIQVGVCISFFVKKKAKGDKKIYYHSTLKSGCLSQADKFKFLGSHDIKDINWTELKHGDSNLIFLDRDYSQKEVYENFWNLTEIFAEKKTGAQSVKDQICISYSKEQQKTIVKDFKNLKEAEIKEKYKEEYRKKLVQLRETRDWTVKRAINDANLNDTEENYRLIHFRPFDIRWCFHSMGKGFFGFPRETISKHMIHDNYALVFPRGVKGEFNHGFVSKYMVGLSMDVRASAKPRIAPLYIYGNGNEKYGDGMDLGEKPRPNFTHKFLNFLSELEFSPTPEELLAYIYSILHSPIYRDKYGDLLKDNYPAIPFTKLKDIFYQYVEIGQKLIDMHLLNNDLDDDEIKVKLNHKGEFVIKKIAGPSGNNNTIKLYGEGAAILTLEGVSEDIYRYEIMNCEPIRNWVTCRKDDKVPLKTDDIAYLKNMVIAIKQTISLVKEIEALGEAYLD